MTPEKKDKWTETSLDSERLLTVKKEEDEDEMKSYLDNSSPNQELSRRLFRQLRYAESSGPHEVLVRLRELCRCWLRPDMYTKEEILERLVMEQFLTILPGETRSWVQLHHPERGEEVVALVKDIEHDPERSGNVFRLRHPHLLEDRINCHWPFHWNGLRRVYLAMPEDNGGKLFNTLVGQGLQTWQFKLTPSFVKCLKNLIYFPNSPKELNCRMVPQMRKALLLTNKKQ